MGWESGWTDSGRWRDVLRNDTGEIIAELETLPPDPHKDLDYSWATDREVVIIQDRLEGNTLPWYLLDARSLKGKLLMFRVKSPERARFTAEALCR